jgi:hypothetical protein
MVRQAETAGTVRGFVRVLTEVQRVLDSPFAAIGGIGWLTAEITIRPAVEAVLRVRAVVAGLLRARPVVTGTPDASEAVGAEMDVDPSVTGNTDLKPKVTGVEKIDGVIDGSSGNNGGG